MQLLPSEFCMTVLSAGTDLAHSNFVANHLNGFFAHNGVSVTKASQILHFCFERQDKTSAEVKQVLKIHAAKKFLHYL
jgi:hypothetical protein